MNVLMRIRPIVRTIKRLLPLLLLAGLIVGLLTGLAVSRMNSDLNVESRALVIIKNVQISMDEVPRSVSVVWERSGVAERAAEAGGLDIDVNELRSDRVEVVGVGGTPLIQVIARGSEAEETVHIANTVADAVVATMNESGGFGRLEVFEPASVNRSIEPTPLPTVPLAVFAGLVGAVGALLAFFGLRSPVHSRGDLALASDAENVEEIWIEKGPPILGAARSLAERLEDLGGEFRLVYEGRGDDLTVPIVTLIGRLNPDIRFTGFPSVSQAPVESGKPRDVLLISSGTPSREVAKAEATTRDLIATVLVHQGLA